MVQWKWKKSSFRDQRLLKQSRFSPSGTDMEKLPEEILKFWDEILDLKQVKKKKKLEIKSYKAIQLVWTEASAFEVWGFILTIKCFFSPKTWEKNGTQNPNTCSLQHCDPIGCWLWIEELWTNQEHVMDDYLRWWARASFTFSAFIGLSTPQDAQQRPDQVRGILASLKCLLSWTSKFFSHYFTLFLLLISPRPLIWFLILAALL